MGKKSIQKKKNKKKKKKTKTSAIIFIYYKFNRSNIIEKEKLYILFCLLCNKKIEEGWKETELWKKKRNLLTTILL